MRLDTKSTRNTGAYTVLQPHCNSLIILSTFSPVIAKTLEMIKNLNSETCHLGTLSTSCLKIIFNSLEINVP